MSGGSYFRRVGESPRDHRRRVKRGQVDRVVASLEDQGRPDLALIVSQTTGKSSVLPGVQYVTLQLVCTKGHQAGAVHVDTYGRFRSFGAAWGEHGQGFGVWQTRRDAERTNVSIANDDHRLVEVVCGDISDSEGLCGRPVQIKMDRLRDELDRLWAPGARALLEWRA